MGGIRRGWVVGDEVYLANKFMARYIILSPTNKKDRSVQKQSTERKICHTHLPTNNDPQIGTGATDADHQEPKGVIYVIYHPLSTGTPTDLSSEVSGPPSNLSDTESEGEKDENGNRYEIENEGEDEAREANKDEDEDGG